MSNILKGIAASEGIAIARAYMLVYPDLSFEKRKIKDVKNEINRFDRSISLSKKELTIIKNKAEKNLGSEEAAVFDAHLTILSDPEIIDQTKDKIHDEKINAEAAFEEIIDSFISIFESMQDNAYMQERVADIKDISKRVLSHLLNVRLPDLALINKEVIVVAHDLTPSDTSQLDRKFIKGFITDIGGRTSHSAIMSRTLEIPSIVGTGDATSKIHDNDIVILDGLKSKVIINPSSEELSTYKIKEKDLKSKRIEWKKLKNKSTVTADGKHVVLASNIGTPEDVEGAVQNGAEAVGLFRSEFLYMDSSELPSEKEQFEAYKLSLQGMHGRQVVVRTMDIGGDKNLPYLSLPQESNPFLGYRAIRVCLNQQDIFRTQLRALLKASKYGKLAIMFPMIATVEEFKKAKSIYEDERQKLIDENVDVSNNIEVGMMMEIPAAAMISDKLSKYVDFFSIGTNDLIQYSMAADRGNERLSYLYQPLNPSILRMIKFIIDSAHSEGKWVGMCGEMAGSQNAVPLLLGLGLDEYSMSSTSILKTRSFIKNLSTVKMKELANKAIECETESEVQDLVREYIK